MKNLIILAAMILAAALTSCGSFNAADLFSGEIRFGLRQGSIAPHIAGDTVSIVRAFPATTIRLLPNVDSNYVLRSGDRLNVMWRPNGEAVMFCEIVADTVSFVRK